MKHQKLDFLDPSKTFALPGMSGISRFWATGAKMNLPRFLRKIWNFELKTWFLFTLDAIDVSLGIGFTKESFSSWAKIPESSFDAIRLSGFSVFQDSGQKQIKYGFKQGPREGVVQSKWLSRCGDWSGKVKNIKKYNKNYQKYQNHFVFLSKTNPSRRPYQRGNESTKEHV